MFTQSGRRMAWWGRREAAGTRHRGSCAAGAGAGARVNIMALVSEKISARRSAQTRRNEHRSTSPVLHSINAERSETKLAGSRRRMISCEACEPDLGACLSPPASDCGTEWSDSGQRAGDSARSCAAAKRSGVKQAETDGVRLRWRRQSANQSAKAQTHRHEHRNRSDCSQSAAASFGARGPRSAACASDALAA
jgi:hypothetical protein